MEREGYCEETNLLVEWRRERRWTGGAINSMVVLGKSNKLRDDGVFGDISYIYLRINKKLFAFEFE